MEPAALTGWLGSLSRVLAGMMTTVGSLHPLSPALAGPMASVAAAAEKPVPVVVREREVRQTRLLAERAVPIAPVAGAAAIGGQPFPLKAFLAKLDELADRPIDVNITVVSKLDGRADAEAVFGPESTIVYGDTLHPRDILALGPYGCPHLRIGPHYGNERRIAEFSVLSPGLTAGGCRLLDRHPEADRAHPRTGRDNERSGGIYVRSSPFRDVPKPSAARQLRRQRIIVQ